MEKRVRELETKVEAMATMGQGIGQGGDQAPQLRDVDALLQDLDDKIDVLKEKIFEDEENTIMDDSVRTFHTGTFARSMQATADVLLVEERSKDALEVPMEGIQLEQSGNKKAPTLNGSEPPFMARWIQRRRAGRRLAWLGVLFVVVLLAVAGYVVANSSRTTHGEHLVGSASPRPTRSDPNEMPEVPPHTFPPPSTEDLQQAINANTMVIQSLREQRQNVWDRLKEMDHTQGMVHLVEQQETLLEEVKALDIQLIRAEEEAELLSAELQMSETAREEGTLDGGRGNLGDQWHL